MRRSKYIQGAQLKMIKYGQREMSFIMRALVYLLELIVYEAVEVAGDGGDTPQIVPEQPSRCCSA